MTEKDLWMRLRGAAKAVGIAAERYENAGSFGTFDVSLSYNNHTTWLELKASRYMELRTSQMHWARKRLDAGCTSDMYVLFPHQNAMYLLEVKHPLYANGRLEINDAVAFSSMGDVVFLLKEKMEKI